MPSSLHPSEVLVPRINSKLLDAMVAEGMISQADSEAAALFAKRRQIHAEEALIQMGVVGEGPLLKYMANFYKTYFVSTKKLSSAPISESLLRMVPHRLARRLLVFPVKFDPKHQELSILAVQPDDLDMLKNVQFATRASKVRALVARPAAIEAAIRVHFEDESQAFGQIRNTGALDHMPVDREAEGQGMAYAPEGPPFQASMPPVPEVGSRATGERRRRPTMGGAGGPPPPPPGPGVRQTMSGQQASIRQTVSGQQAPVRQTVSGQQAPVIPAQGMPGTQPFPMAQPMAPGHGQMPYPGQHPMGMAVLPTQLGAPMALPHAQTVLAMPDADLGALPLQGQMPVQVPALEAADAKPAPPPGVPIHDYLETLNVMVALLENDRGDLRGHSVSVARIVRRVCERLGLNQDDMDTILIATYLHDIGKSSAYHLTALNVAEYDAHRQQARKSYLTPVRIFEAVRLPSGVHDILTHLYECFDGQGFPDRLTGKEIALGARILAIVETYCDLTGHAGNPFRKRLSPQEAWDVLAKYRGKVFDGNLVDVFKTVVLGDDLRAKLLANSRRALIVDADAEDTTVLELRLAEHGFEVTIARNAHDAENELKGEFDVVVSEVDLKPSDGFTLLQNVRAAGNEVPFIFLSKESDSETVQRGFELGADDFITKPASPEVVALKINRVLDGAKRKRKSGGVSGSLAEMGLPDVVQILFHGRKSGKLTITAGGKRGEILFSEGQIFDACFGELREEEGFYALLNLDDGDFELDPNFRPTNRIIEVSPESLLLEGMRRLDEAGR